MELLLALWLFVAVLTAIIASKKGRTGFGWFILGAFFGIFALIVAAAIGPADQPASSLTAKLEELDRLKRRGTISQDEYETKKSSLLT